MLRTVLMIIVTSILLFSLSTSNDDCTKLSSHYFAWLNSDGSLAIPSTFDGWRAQEQDVNDNPICEGLWTPLTSYPNCQFCVNNSYLICHGSNVYNIPSPAVVPAKNLSLFKMSGVGLISLSPRSFSGMSIEKLVIENSNLTYIAFDTFSGVRSIKFIYLKNNTLDYISQADSLFHDIPDLKYLSLENNGLKVLSSEKSSNMTNLKYFSLAGNPIYAMDVFFLQNSGLTFLNLKGAKLKMKDSDVVGSGLSLLPSTLNTLDLSRAEISGVVIEKMLQLLRRKNLTTLNLGYLESYDRLWVSLLHIKKTLQYLSLEGTDMSKFFPLEKTKNKFLNSGPFVKLRELNLKNCNISDLDDGKIFAAFPNLSVLSLSGNQFYSLDLTVFSNFPNVYYLDFSKNIISQFIPNAHAIAKNLKSVDLSFVKFYVDDKYTLSEFFNSISFSQNVSLCKAAFSEDCIKQMEVLHNLKFLDISETFSSDFGFVPSLNDLFAVHNSTLIELHFANNYFEFNKDYPLLFSQLSSLETLNLSSNLIRELSPDMFGPSLKNLVISQNLITTWYFSLLNNESQLESLDLSKNQITYVSEAMLHDFYKLNTLDLSSSPLICNNKVVAMVCSNVKNKTENLKLVNLKDYHCYDVNSNGYRRFTTKKECEEYYSEVSSTHKPQGFTTKTVVESTLVFPTTERIVKNTRHVWNWEWTYVVIGPIVLISAIGGIVYLKWWNIKCFLHRYVSLKKAKLLRKDEGLITKSEIQYDVFVSYSDVDRSWVLDHLVPNMEIDGDISLCFHERDFQVGLSILENIIDCMDRSHSLLLVVSSGFVRSKWCQFEMHLAQYRLIETFRDQLVLVLLEDIPRKLRPQTLHHLMMTKTYLMWPQEPTKGDAMELFWKRLKRALKPNPNYVFEA